MAKRRRYGSHKKVSSIFENTPTPRPDSGLSNSADGQDSAAQRTGTDPYVRMTPQREPAIRSYFRNGAPVAIIFAVAFAAFVISAKVGQGGSGDNAATEELSEAVRELDVSFRKVEQTTVLLEKNYSELQRLKEQEYLFAENEYVHQIEAFKHKIRLLEAEKASLSAQQP